MTDDSRAKFCILVNEIKFRETAFYTARDLTRHPWEREPRALTLTDLTLPLMLNNCTYLDGYPKFQIQQLYFVNIKIFTSVFFSFLFLIAFLLQLFGNKSLDTVRCCIGFLFLSSHINI